MQRRHRIHFSGSVTDGFSFEIAPEGQSPAQSPHPVQPLPFTGTAGIFSIPYMGGSPAPGAL